MSSMLVTANSPAACPMMTGSTDHILIRRVPVVCRTVVKRVQWVAAGPGLTDGLQLPRIGHGSPLG